MFGEQRLIGHLNWTNTARSFDAARLTLQRGKVKVDLFAASVVNAKEATANKSAGGNDRSGPTRSRRGRPGRHGEAGAGTKTGGNADTDDPLAGLDGI